MAAEASCTLALRFKASSLSSSISSQYFSHQPHASLLVLRLFKAGFSKGRARAQAAVLPASYDNTHLHGVQDAQKVREAREQLTVGDCMTKGHLHVAKVTTLVYEALEVLVANRISGMPVVDDEGRVVGVVSDYDLLALDSISGEIPTQDGMFPQTSSTWKAFKEIQKLLSKNHGTTVGEVMTTNPLCVRPLTNFEDAARILVQSKLHRLPVVDDKGVLVGLLTRGNVVRAALMMKRAAEGKALSTSGGN